MSLAFFESERDAITYSIQNISVTGAHCFDPRQRELIEQNIRDGGKVMQATRLSTPFYVQVAPRFELYACASTI